MNIVLHGEILQVWKAFSLRPGMRHVPAFCTAIEHCAEVPAKAVGQEKDERQPDWPFVIKTKQNTQQTRSRRLPQRSKGPVRKAIGDIIFNDKKRKFFL